LLASGSIEDYNHYRQVVGSISGIEWCQERLINTYNKRMEADD